MGVLFLPLWHLRRRWSQRRGPPELGVNRNDLVRRVAQFRQEAADEDLRSKNRFRDGFLIARVRRSEHFLQWFDLVQITHAREQGRDVEHPGLSAGHALADEGR